jgi:formate dehydrogenase major subunit
MVKAKIDGREYTFPSGISALDAATSVDVEIPTLCSDERIGPCGACRTCLVRVKGSPRPVASCTTPIQDGMEIQTSSPDLAAARRMNLRMLAHRYSSEEFLSYPDKPFHRLAREYGLTEADFTGDPHPQLFDDTHPYIRVDMSRCIECYRCVRICEEIPGRSVWQVEQRGQATRIVPNSRTTLLESSCISCGACVETCPSGALEDKTVLERGTATKWTRTTCPYCGVGCEMYAGTRDDRLVQMMPVADAPVNRGHLCVKGRYAFGYMDAPDRVTEPMIRRSGVWESVTWDEAISFTAQRLREIIDRSGPDSVGVLGSARATNEENYVTQKFARVALRTNNVDCCARVCHAPSAGGLKVSLGTGAATNSFDDIEITSAIMICGANPTESHPIVGERILQTVRRRGIPLIVIDPRRTELARAASVHLQLRPGTNIPLLNAIGNVIVSEGLLDEVFAGERLESLDEYRTFIAPFTPEYAAEVCGVEAEDIRRAARLYAESKPAMCFHGLGMTEHTQGTDGVMCIANLALLTGNVGKAGSGVNPLRGQNNVQGSAAMGCDPTGLTGSTPVEAGRALFERVWEAPLPVTGGMDLLQMIDAAAEGRFRALCAIGYDLAFTNADTADTTAALKALELIVVQDMFLNETARDFAHVFLPASSSFEKEGTFMNAERRIQLVRPAVQARGSSRSDWEIVCDLAAAMGAADKFAYTSAKDIWNEVREVWPAVAGISYERIENGGIQWPCPDEDHPGTGALHAGRFTSSDRAAIKCIPYRPTPEMVSSEYPFLLNTGRNRYAFNAGTMTGRTGNAKLRPTDLLSLNPADLEKLSLLPGDRVRVTSRYGNAVLPVVGDKGIREGEAFATFHDPAVLLNNLTGPHRDRQAHTPEYKVTAVQITPSS